MSEALQEFDDRFFVYFDEVEFSLRFMWVGRGWATLRGVQALHQDGALQDYQGVDDAILRT